MASTCDQAESLRQYLRSLNMSLQQVLANLSPGYNKAFGYGNLKNRSNPCFISYRKISTIWFIPRCNSYSSNKFDF